MHADRRRRPAPPEEASSQEGCRIQSGADERRARRVASRPRSVGAQPVTPRGLAVLALSIMLLTPRPALVAQALVGLGTPTGAVGMMLTATPGALVARVLVGACTPTIMLTTTPPAPPVSVLAGGGAGCARTRSTPFGGASLTIRLVGRQDTLQRHPNARQGQRACRGRVLVPVLAGVGIVLTATPPAAPLVPALVGACTPAQTDADACGAQGGATSSPCPLAGVPPAMTEPLKRRSGAMLFSHYSPSIIVVRTTHPPGEKCNTPW
jgi:hypothetical protein